MLLNNHLKKENRQPLGFTLMELPLVILIMALTMLAIYSFVRIGVAQLHEEQAVRVISNTKDAIEKFRGLVAFRYPCPASPTSNGYEDCTITPVLGTRDADGDGSVDKALVGTLPTYVKKPSGSWIALSSLLTSTDIIQTNTIDPWHNKLIYAVSENLTLAAPNTKNNLKNGVIKVIDEFGNPTAGVNDNAQYVIVSKGPNNIGCDAVSHPREAENCDNNSTFMIALKQTAKNTTFFDDYVGVGMTYESILWKPDSTVSTQLKNDVSLDNVAIKKNTVAAGLKLDVSGTIKADNNVRGSTLCDKSETNCFNPKSILSVSCPPSALPADAKKIYMTGTELDSTTGTLKAKCSELVIKKPASSTACSTSTPVLKGIFSDGGFDCIAIP